MRRLIIVLMMIFIPVLTFSQNDTLFIFQSGGIIYQRATINVDSIKTNSPNDTIHIFENNTVVYSNAVNETDSILFYSPAFQGFICGVDSVYDIDGNAYSTIQLGNQCWMRESLKVTHYPDSTPIPYISDDTQWGNMSNNNTNDAYCIYNNNANNEVDTYGALYSWPAAIADNWEHDHASNQGVCPDGWHLPSDDEVKQLEIFVGMSQNQADMTGLRGAHFGSMLSADKQLWVNDSLVFDPDFEDSGFDKLPTGGRYSGAGEFHHLGERTWWWTRTEAPQGSGDVWLRRISYDYTQIKRLPGNKSHGLSIRCLKD